MRALPKSKRAVKLLLSVLLIGVVGLAVFTGFLHSPNHKVGDRLVPHAELADDGLQELSGLVASSRYPGVLWAHSDSGNEPYLYALDTEGDSSAIELQDVTLYDWEAIARCGDKLYVTELGNNLNASKKLGVYEFIEPDPDKTETLKAERFIPVRYADQESYPPTDRWRFDCEAAYCFGGSLYFVTKNRPAFRLFVQEGGANLYRLDMQNLSEDNVLQQIDSAHDLGGWVTAADISADEEWLALLIESPQQGIWLFQRPQSGDKFFSDARKVKRYKFYDGGQLESLAFVKENDYEVLVMINEERQVFRVDMGSFLTVDRSAD
jgi:hypothetical protein